MFRTDYSYRDNGVRDVSVMFCSIDFRDRSISNILNKSINHRDKVGDLFKFGSEWVLSVGFLRQSFFFYYGI